MFETIMNLIENVIDGDAVREDLIGMAGIIIPENRFIEPYETLDGIWLEEEFVEEDWAHAHADPSIFTEEQCDAINTALHDMYECYLEWEAFDSERNAYYNSTRGV